MNVIQNFKELKKLNNLWKIYEKEPLEFINSLIHVPSMQRLKDTGMNCGVEYTAFDFFQIGRAHV